MLEKIAILTDSTCDLPLYLRQTENIFMVPLSIYFGEEEFLDGIDLTPEQFYEKFIASSQLPTTSQPSAGKFLEMFQTLAKEGYTQLICIHLSKKFSGTAQSAAVAAKMIPNLKIEIIDSKVCTWGLGGLVLYASRLLREGNSFQDIIEKVNSQIPKTAIYFSMDNMDTLERGGRIGKAKALIGKYLGVRPILCMGYGTGEIEVVEKHYSANAASDAMQKLALEHVRKHGVCQIVGVLKTGVSRNGDLFLEKLNQTPLAATLQQGVIGGVIGSHVGPTAWGIMIC